MKNTDWLIKKIVEEFITLDDIRSIRSQIEQGEGDRNILRSVRKQLVQNGDGIRSYIGNEKTKAIALKIAYRIHWVFILAIIKDWLKILEATVRWQEDKHADMIISKAKELEGLLKEEEAALKRNPHDEAVSDSVIDTLERAAEEIIREIDAA